jgi:hypothetical protein
LRFGLGIVQHVVDDERPRDGIALAGQCSWLFVGGHRSIFGFKWRIRLRELWR